MTNGGSGFRTYAYDGNATSDGLSNTVTYNLFNLPATITAKSLTYTYDATGNKPNQSIGQYATDYIGGIVYDGGTISFVQTEDQA